MARLDLKNMYIRICPNNGREKLYTEKTLRLGDSDSDNYLNEASRCSKFIKSEDVLK